MLSNTSSRQDNPVIWALISDGKQAYIFTYRKDNTISTLREAWKTASCNDKYHSKNQTYLPNKRESREEDNRNLAMRKANDDADGLSSKDNSSDARFYKTTDSTSNFISTVAATIDQAIDNKAFDYLVPIAPRETFRALRDCLSEAALSRLMTNMPEGFVYDKKGARCIG